MLFLTACGSDPATFTQVQSEILTPSCSFQACHMAPATQAAGLALDTGAYEMLVNAAAVEAMDKVRVVPGDLAASYLMNKLENRDIAMGGAMMPPTQMLSEERLEIVRSWIEAGAAND